MEGVSSTLVDGSFIEDTKSALVLEDLIGQFLYSNEPSDTEELGMSWFKKVTLLWMAIGLSFSVSAATVDSTNPYKMMHSVAEQTFNRLKAKQPKVQESESELLKNHRRTRNDAVRQLPIYGTEITGA